jgi:hypothetical protein
MTLALGPTLARLKTTHTCSLPGSPSYAGGSPYALRSIHKPARRRTSAGAWPRVGGDAVVLLLLLALVAAVLLFAAPGPRHGTRKLPGARRVDPGATR